MLRRKFWLIVSAVLMAAYFAYVICAKFATTIGPPPMRLSETGEFLLFLASVIAFALQVIVEDAGRGKTATHSGDEA